MYLKCNSYYMYMTENNLQFIYDYMKLSFDDKTKRFGTFNEAEKEIFFKEKERIYREVNKDKLNEKSRKYYEKNKDKIAAKQKINRDKINAKQREKYKLKKEAIKDKN